MGLTTEAYAVPVSGSVRRGAAGCGDRVDEVVETSAESLAEQLGDLVLRRVGERVAVEEDHVAPCGAGQFGGGRGAVPAGGGDAPRAALPLEADGDAADAGALEPGEGRGEAVAGGRADDEGDGAVTGGFRRGGRQVAPHAVHQLTAARRVCVQEEEAAVAGG
jgi:hypothetical protein